MRTNNFKYLVYSTFVSVFLFMLGSSPIAQTIDEQIIDSITKEPVPIALANISIRSGEVAINTKKVLESLISQEKIQLIKSNNDSLLFQIDSLMEIERKSNLRIKNIRYLNNKQIFWEILLSSIESEKSSLADLVYDLDEIKYKLEDEIIVWKKTKEIVEKDEASSAVTGRINDLIYQMDSVKMVVQQKSELLLYMLDNTTTKELAVTDHLSEIESALIEKEEQLFEQDQPALWNLDFSGKALWNIRGSLHQFNKMEVKNLIRYFKMHIPNVIFQLILILILIISFVLIKRKLPDSGINDASFYQRMLKKIFARPVSAALVLGLFASILIFPNRPILFRDLSRLVVSFPIIIITISLVESRFKKYVLTFGLLLFIQFLSFVFPPGNILYILSLTLISIIELIVIFNLFRYFQKHPLKRKFFNGFFKGLLIFHFGFALAGFLGIMWGSTFLSELTLNVALFNALAGILIVITTIIINGLIEVGIDSKAGQKLNVIQLHGTEIKKKVVELINFTAIIYWVLVIMRIINIDRLVIDAISTFLTNPINIGSVSFSVGGVIIFFLVIWLSSVISKIIRVILEKDILDNFNLAKGVPHTVSVLVRYTIVTLGVILAVSAAGMPLNSLTILFGAFGVGIGFGLQNIFNNLVSGLILLFERPIQIGDTIEVGQLTGNVKSIGIRSSNVRTFDGAEVIVPNGLLISNEVVNWTLSDQTRRIEVLAGVAYGSDPHKVKDLFVKVLDKHPDIIKNPEPRVLFNDLGESSLDFRLLFWTSNFDDWIRIRSEIIFEVHDILKAEGIEIPFPQRDLHLRSVDKTIEIKSNSKDQTKNSES